MRIGGGTPSSHHAGTSAMWHDIDYVPDKAIDTPTVQKHLEGMPLPSEQHQVPEGFEDPFAKMDKVYDAAAMQMEPTFHVAGGVHPTTARGLAAAHARLARRGARR